jgi:hypothetical protein
MPHVRSLNDDWRPDKRDQHSNTRSCTTDSIAEHADNAVRPLDTSLQQTVNQLRPSDNPLQPIDNPRPYARHFT